MNYYVKVKFIQYILSCCRFPCKKKAKNVMSNKENGIRHALQKCSTKTNKQTQINICT